MARDQDANDRTMVERVDPLVGSVLDRRYKIDFRLAAGGFGAIYRGTHIKSGHEVALKVLHPQLTTDAGVVARFRREGATMTTLRSPHTITAYELGEAEDGTLYIVMELLLGESMFERFRASGRFEWKRMARIARAICDSLGEAHDLGIIHRDLKPTNIHLELKEGDPDFVKVLDFGIAKILRDSDFDSSDLTNAGQMIGTLDYMSPEQMVGGTCTGQSDIYTLGILIYEMVAGVRPFAEAQSAAAALAAILKSTAPPLSKRVPVPEELDRILARCMERDPLKRYSDVNQLAADLDHLISGQEPDEVTRTVSIDPMDAGGATMTSLPPPNIAAMRANLAHTPRPNPANTPRPSPANTPRPGPANTPQPGRAAGATAPPKTDPARAKPPTNAPPLRPKPPSAPPPLPSSGEFTWQGDAPPAGRAQRETGTPRPDAGRAQRETGAPRQDTTADPFSTQATTPNSVLPASARQSGLAPEQVRRKTPTASPPRTPLPPDSDNVTTPIPKFSRAPTTPPTGMPSASPFKTTLPGAQMPPNPNAPRVSQPQFFPPTPYPQQPPGFPQTPPPVAGYAPFPQTPPPVASYAPPGFPPTPPPVAGYPPGFPPPPPPAANYPPAPFPASASYAPQQPIDDGRGSRPILDLNAFPQQPRMAPTPSPGGYPPQAPAQGGYPPQAPGGYDMGQMQAREAEVRRWIWIAVLVIAAIAGIVLASQL